jgi:hypothetical protein
LRDDLSGKSCVAVSLLCTDCIRVVILSLVEILDTELYYPDYFLELAMSYFKYALLDNIGLGCCYSEIN